MEPAEKYTKLAEDTLSMSASQSVPFAILAAAYCLADAIGDSTKVFNNTYREEQRASTRQIADALNRIANS